MELHDQAANCAENVAITVESVLSLLGWSHGATSLMWALRPGFLPDIPQLRTAIALYPACSAIAKVEGWQPSVPLTVLMEADDDWTPSAPCRDLAGRAGYRYIEYVGACHGFDEPILPVRVRSGLDWSRAAGPM